MMKKVFLSLLLCLVGLVGVQAQEAADRILGTYKVITDGDVSHVKISKTGDTFKVQVIWLEVPNNPDGTPKTDFRNPDKSRRGDSAAIIVLAQGLKFNGEVWTGTKIYDPTKGKSFNVKMWFKDEKTLTVQGSLMMFTKTLYWEKLD